MNSSHNEKITRTIPSIIIAGISSDSGKTTVVRGLISSFIKRGLIVQPYKIGPDFIDPSHHTKLCGRISRNLDPIIMGEDRVRQTFSTASVGADIAVIEGVMGMFDGIDGTMEGSTAHVAQILNAPIILVIPVKGISTTVHAIIKGFSIFNPLVKVSGVILNHVASERHRLLLSAYNSDQILGYIPMREELQIGQRHLGLLMAHELVQSSELASIIEGSCDIDRILHIAEEFSVKVHEFPSKQIPDNRIKIGIAYDAAFCFYYQDNLDLLSYHGADLVFFSPMIDPVPDVQALYIGGGYPELYAQVLEQSPTSHQIRSKIEEGMPVYGECGGLMYLTSGITGDVSARWVGVLPAQSFMESRFQALGYTNGTTTSGSGLLSSGIQIKGHEFHYSKIIPEPDARFCINLSIGKGIIDGKDGLFEENCVGSYTHAYFSERFASGFIRAAAMYEKG